MEKKKKSRQTRRVEGVICSETDKSLFAQEPLHDWVRKSLVAVSNSNEIKKDNSLSEASKLQEVETVRGAAK